MTSRITASVSRAPSAPLTGGGRGDPYLSVVVTARNDNHGGDLLFRMQVFVNALAAQCNRFGLPTELILVEWNPPADRPRLAEALSWPQDGDQLTVRIIEVGETLHRRFRYSERLPLFQMIAKNVGIRRARGRFVLATNIDIVFSDKLMRFLVERRLRPGRFYRVDRYDVAGVRDADAPIDEQLRICEESLIRICGRYGTLDLRTGEFYRVWLKYATLPWYAAFALQALASLRRRLGVRLGAVAEASARLGRALRAVRVRLGERRSARRHALRRGLRIVYRLAGGVARRTARLLRSRGARLVFRGLVRPWKWPKGVWVVAVYTPEGMYRLRRLPRALARRLLRLLRRLDRRLLRYAWRARGVVRRLSHAYGFVRRVRIRRPHVRGPRLATRWKAIQEAVIWAKALPALHTNGCGDFTLMSREGWFELKAYPELHTFSMFIDSIFVYQAHWHGFGEEFLRVPIYHLEHGGGFRPDAEGRKDLNKRLENAGIPQIDHQQFRSYAIEMYRTGRPIDFNDDGWGFAGLELPETVLCVPESVAVLTGSADGRGT